MGARLPSRTVLFKVAKSVLPRIDISLVFVGPTQARSLNKKLRGKTYTPNVLSYLASATTGEIIICPSVADTQASDYGMSKKDFILYLFIHGLLHLKGWAHSGTMEECERMLLATYSDTFTHPTNETTHRNRNRHRHVPSKNGRGRRTRR